MDLYWPCWIIPPSSRNITRNNWTSLTHGPAVAEAVNHSLKLPPDSFLLEPMAHSPQKGMCLLAAALPAGALPGVPIGQEGRRAPGSLPSPHPQDPVGTHLWIRGPEGLEWAGNGWSGQEHLKAPLLSTRVW